MGVVVFKHYFYGIFSFIGDFLDRKVRRGHNKTPATGSSLEAFGHLFKLTLSSVLCQVVVHFL